MLGVVAMWIGCKRWYPNNCSIGSKLISKSFENQQKLNRCGQIIYCKLFITFFLVPNGSLVALRMPELGCIGDVPTSYWGLAVTHNLMWQGWKSSTFDGGLRTWSRSAEMPGLSWMAKCFTVGASYVGGAPVWGVFLRSLTILKTISSGMWEKSIQTYPNPVWNLKNNSDAMAKCHQNQAHLFIISFLHLRSTQITTNRVIWRKQTIPWLFEAIEEPNLAALKIRFNLQPVRSVLWENFLGCFFHHSLCILAAKYSWLDNPVLSVCNLPKTIFTVHMQNKKTGLNLIAMRLWMKIGHL